MQLYSVNMEMSLNNMQLSFSKMNGLADFPYHKKGDVYFCCTHVRFKLSMCVFNKIYFMLQRQLECLKIE